MLICVLFASLCVHVVASFVQLLDFALLVFRCISFPYILLYWSFFFFVFRRMYTNLCFVCISPCSFCCFRSLIRFCYIGLSLLLISLYVAVLIFFPVFRRFSLLHVSLCWSLSPICPSPSALLPVASRCWWGWMVTARLSPSGHGHWGEYTGHGGAEGECHSRSLLPGWWLFLGSRVTFLPSRYLSSFLSLSCE